MAVDRKADHVGNHGGVYTDIDGQTKQFTVIDHDKKVKISPHIPESEKEIKEREKWNANFLKERIETVLLLPPTNIYNASGGIYNTLLNIFPTEVTWNEEAVKVHLTNNPLSFLVNLLWKRTVPMAYWHHPMWQEGNMDWLRAGEWKELIP